MNFLKIKNELYKLILFITIPLLLIFSSCNKSTNNNYTLPTGNYFFEKQGDYSSIRIFTKNGGINDSNIVNKYKIIYDSLIYPHKNMVHTIDTFNIINNSLAIHSFKALIYKPPYILANYRDTTYSNFEITPIDNYYKFQGIDTLKFNGFVDTSGFSFQKYKFYNSMRSFSSPFGGPDYTVVNTFKSYIVYFNAGYLIFPEINFIKFYNTNWSSSLSYGSVNNIFEINHIDKISAGDTMIFQTYNVYYSK